jgi:hypothetical protein
MAQMTRPCVDTRERPLGVLRPLRRIRIALPIAALLGLTGCDLLGIESASDVAARREAEGKAVGGACRQAARSIEECYETNKRADKAAVFTGWREMNDSMRENNLQAQPAGAGAAPQVAEAEVEPGPQGMAAGGGKSDAADAGGADRSARDGKAPNRAAEGAGPDRAREASAGRPPADRPATR